ncbi:hypothetical protein FSP39_005275 [Pinctada imbricata]|uniref:Uncharacterized protein n=1 Tax=Pinctada imbricata TaxID=66713 RepID=A0AA88Y502_PINIB|nr:hypothetical protein FSP39_005275 [Pinctada imbricata]
MVGSNSGDFLTDPNTLVPSMGDFVRIVCSLCNKLRKPLASKENDGNTNRIDQRMIDLSQRSNSLKSFLEENSLLQTRSMYKLLEATDLPDFPVLSIDDMRTITMGVYQVKQSPSYTKEHKDEDGSYQMNQQYQTKGPEVNVETILDAANIPQTDLESSGSEDESVLEEE